MNNLTNGLLGNLSQEGLSFLWETNFERSDGLQKLIPAIYSCSWPAFGLTGKIDKDSAICINSHSLLFECSFVAFWLWMTFSCHGPWFLVPQSSTSWLFHWDDNYSEGKYFDQLLYTLFIRVPKGIIILGWSNSFLMSAWISLITATKPLFKISWLRAVFVWEHP